MEIIEANWNEDHWICLANRKYNSHRLYTHTHNTKTRQFIFTKKQIHNKNALYLVEMALDALSQ